MNSVNPGDYLGQLMGSSAKGANTSALDAQILKLANSAPATSTSTAIDTDSPAALAQAAQTADAQRRSSPQSLELGFGPGAQINTHIPLPHWIDNVLSSFGGTGAKLYQDAKQKLGLNHDALVQAAAVPEQQGVAGQIGKYAADTLIGGGGGALVGAGLAAAAPETGAAALLGSPLALAMAGGATQGALTAEPGQTLSGAGIGAAGGGLLHGAGAGMSKLVQGLARSPEAQALIQRGVALTPGMFKPKGLVNRVEQALSAWPGIGTARAAAPVSYAKAMAQDAAAPGAKLGTDTGDFQNWVGQAKDTFDQAYDSVLGQGRASYPMAPKIMRVGTDIPLDKALTNLAGQPRLGLTAAERSNLGTTAVAHLRETIAAAKRSGGMTATDLQGLRSIFRQAASDVSPLDNSSRALRSFWQDAAGKVTAAMESQLPKDAAQNLQAIDARYPAFSVVRDVARSIKDKEMPTAEQFSQAIKNHTAPNAYATGNGWNRDLAKAASRTFSSTVPQTGLTGQALVAPIVHGAEGLGVAALANHHPLAAAGLGALLLGTHSAYSAPGLRAFAGQTGLQKALQGKIGSIPPALRGLLGQGARTAALQGLLEQQQQPAGLLSP